MRTKSKRTRSLGTLVGIVLLVGTHLLMGIAWNNTAGTTHPIASPVRPDHWIPSFSDAGPTPVAVRPARTTPERPSWRQRGLWDVDVTPGGRTQRFPSVAERVVAYLSSWYDPPSCPDDYARIQHTGNGTWTVHPPVTFTFTPQESLAADAFLQPHVVRTHPVDHVLFALATQPLQICINHSTIVSMRDNYCPELVQEILPQYEAFQRNTSVSSSTHRPETDLTIPLLVVMGDTTGRQKISSSNNTVVAAYATIPYLRRVRPVWNAASVGGETSSRTTPQGNKPRPIIPNASCASLASRPLVDGHLQPILWKFGSRRHYNHIERKVEAHDIPWAQKLDRAVFRGSLTGRMPMDRPERERCRSMPRCNLVWQHANSTLVDAKLSKLDGRPLPNMLDGVLLTGAALSQQELLQFKALIMLEGNDVSTGLKWALLSNSLVLMPPPTVTSWAMEEWLQPYVHYVPLLPDLSNAEAQMRWILAHDRDAQQIALRGKLWMQDLLFHPQATEDNAAINQEIMRRYRGLFQVVPSEG